MTVTARRISGFTHEVDNGRGHTVLADEPPESGGADRGPRPSEFVAFGLASCTAITVEMYAQRKGIALEQLEVSVDYETDSRAGRASYDVLLKVPAELSEEEMDRLRVIAGKCPVHKTLVGEIEINDRIERLPG